MALAMQNAFPELLTERERTCLRLVHAHWNSKQIARQLGIKPGTVDKYCESASRKLNAGSRINAAMLLVAAEPHPNGSYYEPLPLALAPYSSPPGLAKEGVHDRDGQSSSNRQLVDGGGHPAADGDHGRQADDGQASGGWNAQTGAVLDAGGGPDRAFLSGRGLAGLQFQSLDFGHGHLARILVVFGIAAIAVLIIIGLTGAERFTFLLQKLRYGA